MKHTLPLVLLAERLETVSDRFGLSVEVWVAVCEHLLPEWYADPERPCDPTTHPPGSPGKVEALRRRVAERRVLWSKRDSERDDESRKPKPPTRLTLEEDDD